MLEKNEIYDTPEERLAFAHDLLNNSHSYFVCAVNNKNEIFSVSEDCYLNGEASLDFLSQVADHLEFAMTDLIKRKNIDLDSDKGEQNE